VSWDREADMVRAFTDKVRGLHDCPWTIYAETAGWDILLAHRDGYQVGIEAKLSLNAKVIEQSLSGTTSYWSESGPDYRAVLVPEGKVQGHMGKICSALGIGIILARSSAWWNIDLPDERSSYRPWPNWCPAQRCSLPDYIPDVEGGHAAPVQLTPWKVRAIKLLILLERRGYVTRADMKALQISPTRWCDHWHGFLGRDETGKRLIRCSRTPDLKAQHPVNWAQIEADFDSWGAALIAAATGADMFGAAA